MSGISVVKEKQEDLAVERRSIKGVLPGWGDEHVGQLRWRR